MFNRQEAFDRAVTGIIGQGRHAREEDFPWRCRYRLGDEPSSLIRCGIGWLIPDGAYRFEFENRTPGLGEFADELDRELARAAGAEEPSDALFLLNLQGAHDGSDTLTAFVEDARQVADRYGLSPAALNSAASKAGLYA